MREFFQAANEQTYAGMSDAALNAKHAEYTEKLKRLEDAVSSYKKDPTGSQQAKISRYTTLAGEIRRDLAVIESVAADKKNRRDLEEETRKRDLTTQGQIAVKRETEKIDNASDEAAIASMQADLENRGIKETLPTDITTARTVYRDLVVTDPNSELASRRKIDAAKVRAENQKALVDVRAKASKDLADHLATIKEPAARAKAAQDAINNQEGTVKMLFKEYETLKMLREKNLIAEDDPDLAAAYGNYESAKAQYLGMVSGVGMPTNVTPVPPPTPTAKGTADMVDEVFK